MQLDIKDFTTAQKLRESVEKMNAFGPRYTGNAAHKAFVKHLKQQLTELGVDIYSDPMFFNRWEEKSSSFYIRSAGRAENIPVSSVFPYSGETGEKGVTGEMVYLSTRKLGYLEAKGKIAVVKVNETDFLPSGIAFDKRRAMPEDVSLPANYSGPIATAFVNFPFLHAAKLAGAKGVVCIWDGMSDERVKGQYLPFILDYQGVPALWIAPSYARQVIEAAQNGQSATLTLTADKEQCTGTETFYCILEGDNRDEAVIVNTHTDGVNCIEENGAIAMLEMIKALKGQRLSRRHIFVFVTGHFRLPMFKSALGGGLQATSKWLSAHPDLWDGKKGHIKAVAGVSVEHLGCMEWRDVEGEYKPTGEIEREIVYTGNTVMDGVYYRALEGRTRVKTLTLRGHNLLHFGEGQPLFNCRIPEIALVAAPDSLCTVSEGSEMEKFDEELMLEQTQTLLNCLTIIDSMPKAAMGKCDQYSLLISKKI